MSSLSVYVQLAVIIPFILKKMETLNEHLQMIYNLTIINHPNQTVTLLCWVILLN